jgi:hypothetical protein
MIHKYETTVKGVYGWAQGELEHVGRIASMKDKDLQYEYAMSTVFGMLHLRNAIFELVNEPDYNMHKTDLLRLHGQVIRTIQHLIRDYKVEKSTIVGFNSRQTLGNLNYLKWPGSRRAKSNKRKTVKNNKA